MERATKDDKTSEMMSQKVDIALSFGWGSYTYIFQTRIKTINGTCAQVVSKTHNEMQLWGNQALHPLKQAKSYLFLVKVIYTQTMYKYTKNLNSYYNNDYVTMTYTLLFLTHILYIILSIVIIFKKNTLHKILK